MTNKMTDSAEEALHSSAMDAADAGIPLEEALERVRASYTQAAIERGDINDDDDVPEEFRFGGGK